MRDLDPRIVNLRTVPIHPKTGSYPVAGSTVGGCGDPMTGAMRSLM
jgi:hypothetical protein